MPLPILTLAGMRAWEDASWQAGLTESGVIARVGAELADHLRGQACPGARLLLLAGHGHNGDDVRAACSRLDGFVTQLVNVADPVVDLPAVQSALARKPDWIIDGLFGIGLNRPLGAAWCSLIRAINAAGIPILAMDVPSGLDADSGASWGDAIEAAVTLTVGAPKAGLLATPAVRFVGRLEIARNTGLLEPIPSAATATATGQWSEVSDFQDFPSRRKVDTHKGDFGHLVIVAGSPGYHGAAVLAARGALGARPGLITVFPTGDCYVPVASQLAAPMVHPGNSKSQLPDRASALVVGPGLAHPDAAVLWKARLQEWWRQFPGPVVVDASALEWIPAGEQCASDRPRVLTPHPGEAARLLGTSADEVQRDRPAALRSLSKRFGGCWVVLKGHHTLVGCATGECWWNGTGNPGLSQGGTGDALSGLLGGMLAQREMAADPLRTIRAAVWRHGAAADALERTGSRWSSEDLASAL